MHMEMDPRLGVVRVVLSERNLLTLLAKLRQESSLRTIHRHIGDPSGYTFLVVSVQKDQEHYQDRQAGPMHHETEALIEDEAFRLELERAIADAEGEGYGHGV